MAGDILQGLLSTCRFLETLTLCNVSNLGCVKVVGPSLRLKHLEMVSCPGLDEIEIHDAPIVSLKRWWCGEAAIRMNKVPHLVQLSMSTCLKAAADEISFFSSCLSQLESLKLRLSSLYDRNPLEPKVLYMVSKLTKLRELEILCEPDLANDLLLLVPLIEALQNLQKIVIRVLRAPTIENMETRTFEEGAAPSSKSSEVEGCPGVLQNLKVLEFAGYRVGTTEDEFISYIANNAAALKTIIINPSYQNEASFYPPGKEARKFEELVYCVAKQWLDKIVPPRVKLVIQGLKEVDPRKLHYWDGILRRNLAYNVAFLFFALDD
ncbi:hypothetical protein LINGRAHAP2_LOCUS25059 [Linum grandiflorum]